MSKKYKYHDPEGMYFISPTLVDWVDLYTKVSFQDIIMDSLQFAMNERGLLLHAWVIMPSHLHMIISSKPEFNISDTMRDFKKFTATQTASVLKDRGDSRAEWLLQRFRHAVRRTSGTQKHKIWQEGDHPIQIDRVDSLERILDYVHNNPVKAGLVFEPEHYRLSSAIDYAGGKGLLPVDLLV